MWARIHKASKGTTKTLSATSQYSSLNGKIKGFVNTGPYLIYCCSAVLRAQWEGPSCGKRLPWRLCLLELCCLGNSLLDSPAYRWRRAA